MFQPSIHSATSPGREEPSSSSAGRPQITEQQESARRANQDISNNGESFRDRESWMKSEQNEEDDDTIDVTGLIVEIELESTVSVRSSSVDL